MSKTAKEYIMDIHQGRTMESEIQNERGKLVKAELRTEALAPILPYQERSGLTILDHRRLGVCGCIPAFDRIKQEYTDLSENLRREFPALRTGAERRVEHFRKIAIRFPPNVSAWIGPYCVDYFFPQVRSGIRGEDGRKAAGLIIEVDGGIHNAEVKMKKDQVRLEEFSRRGLIFHGIPNGDLHLRRLFSDLRLYYSADTKAKRRLLVRLYIWTLLAHLSNSDVAKIFELSPEDLEMLLGLVNERRQKFLESRP